MAHKYSLIFLVGIVSVAALCFDLYPSLLGSYADRRFVLTFVILLTAPLSVFAGFGRMRGVVYGYWVFVASVVFSGLLGTSGSEFLYVESVFYPALLLSVVGIGYLISQQSLAVAGLYVNAVVAGAVVYSLLTPAVYLFAITDGVGRLDQFLPWGFWNIRYWSQVASWMLPVLPLAVMVGPLRDNRLWRLGVAITAGIWWWLVLVSSARGCAVGLIAASVLTTLLFGKPAWRWLRVFGIHLGYGLIVWSLFSLAIPWLLFDHPEMRTIGSDASGRIPLWYEAWRMSLQHFPFGMGSQSWLTHDVITSAYEGGKKFGHPHNMYLMWAAEYGWLAVGGLAVIGCSVVRRLFVVRHQMQSQRLAPEHSVLIVGITASVIAAMVHAGVSAVLLAPSSLLIGLLIAGLFWALLTRDIELGRDQGCDHLYGQVGWGRYSLCVIVVAILVVWQFEVIRYYQAMRDDEPLYLENVPQSKMPRFWIHGNFPRNEEWSWGGDD
ncbi:O-antigen ligase family protein [Halospina denitrificans]|nr:O-antigen ligase family protein [Halospina denitrificans]